MLPTTAGHQHLYKGMFGAVGKIAVVGSSPGCLVMGNSLQNPCCLVIVTRSWFFMYLVGILLRTIAFLKVDAAMVCVLQEVSVKILALLSSLSLATVAVISVLVLGSVLGSALTLLAI